MPSFFLQAEHTGGDQTDAKTGADKLRFKPAANHQPRAERQRRDAQKLISSTHKKHPLHKAMQGVFHSLRMIHKEFTVCQHL